jgi:hypothetical protein
VPANLSLNPIERCVGRVLERVARFGDFHTNRAN